MNPHGLPHQILSLARLPFRHSRLRAELMVYPRQKSTPVVRVRVRKARDRFSVSDGGVHPPPPKSLYVIGVVL